MLIDVCSNNHHLLSFYFFCACLCYFFSVLPIFLKHIHYFPSQSFNSSQALPLYLLGVEPLTNSSQLGDLETACHLNPEIIDHLKEIF